MTVENYDIDISNPKTNEERAKAIATLVIVCIANVCNVLGFAFDADTWVNAALSVISAASILYAWWKNQNVTGEAASAQILLDALKAERRAAKHAAAE